MKNNYSRLWLAFVSSTSIFTTLGLSAQPGLSWPGKGDICIYKPLEEHEEVKVIAVFNSGEKASVIFLSNRESDTVLTDDLDCR